MSAKSQLVGHWRYTNDFQSCDCVFLEDGTFTGNITRGKKVISEFTGRWSLENDVLTYIYTNDVFNLIQPGYKDCDRLVEISEDYYVIKPIGDNERKYVRVR